MKSDKLRNYEEGTSQYFLYKEMHENQTIELVKEKKRKYGQLDQRRMTIQKALSLMDEFIDPSDPDLDVENSVHAYQTAERVRKKYPENKEFQIIGLIHDVGKVLFSFGEPSWLVVGDTYVLGCKFPESIVYYDTLKKHFDYLKYDKNGIYEEGCGLDKLVLSYGHDEYLYNVLKGNKNHRISDRYLDVIRYHSFYPWHTEGEYKQFMNEKDEEILRDVLEFNNFDLYSKEDDIEVITPEIKQYYDRLLNEYFDGELNW
ncbi:MAG: inositol oxygenase [Acidimicrobiaceae bacterium]|nr:inositol oxygenase [Acidimicrobiaceae bacterium]|tara:strand:- start:1726 stop:2502 length:777 start_codon:yes stop_codon:yes gene_type:complete